MVDVHGQKSQFGGNISASKASPLVVDLHAFSARFAGRPRAQNGTSRGPEMGVFPSGFRCRLRPVPDR